jgi:hypothetical protein
MTDEEGGAALFAVTLAIIGAWYFGFFEKTTYRPEVGYYEGKQAVWTVGSDMTREECTGVAIAHFNNLNAEPPHTRAFSWACRKMQGEKFLERVR